MLRIQAVTKLFKTLTPGTPLVAKNALGVRFLRHLQQEPEYLDSDEIQIPTYPPVNVQLKAYDYTVLESFSGYVHKTAENMDIEVEDVWAVPGQKLNVTTFKPFSVIVDSQYNLTIYERNVQLTDLPATSAPIFFSIIQAALPEGVKMKIKLHEEEDELVRYVPDQELTQLKSELEALGGASKAKQSSKRK